MAKQSPGMFSSVLKKFLGAWSLCPCGTAVLMRLYMRSMKQAGLKYSEKPYETVWDLDGVLLICFGPCLQPSLLTQMQGWEQGESEPTCQNLPARDPDPEEKPQRQAREKHIRRFLDMAVLFQIPNCLSMLCPGTSVLQYTV